MRGILLAIALFMMLQMAVAQETQTAKKSEISMLGGAPSMTGEAIPDVPALLAPRAAMVEPVTPASEKLVEKPHKFFDKKNISLSVMTFGAALADGITTQHALGQSSVSMKTVNGVQKSFTTTYVEQNPIAAPLVNRGWPGQIAATALTTGASLGISNLLHRSGHHKMERIVPFIFAGTSASFAAHNAKYW